MDRTGYEIEVGRKQRLYQEKNEYLRKFLEPVDAYEFYREIFPEGTFERRGHYEDARANGIAVTIPQSGKANGIALEIEGDGRAKRYTITDDLENCRSCRKRILPLFLRSPILESAAAGRMLGTYMRWCSIWMASGCPSSGTPCIR